MVASLQPCSAEALVKLAANPIPVQRIKGTQQAQPKSAQHTKNSKLNLGDKAERIELILQVWMQWKENSGKKSDGLCFNIRN